MVGSHPSKGLEAQGMPLDCLYLVAPGVPAGPIHLEGYMLRDRPLREGADKSRPKTVEGPFCRGGAEEPAAYPGEIQVRHFVFEGAY